MIYSSLISSNRDVSDFREVLSHDLDSALSELGYLSEVCGNLSKSSEFKKDYNKLKSEVDKCISNLYKVREDLEKSLAKGLGLDRKKWDKAIDLGIASFDKRVGSGVSFEVDKYLVELTETGSGGKNVEIVVSGGSGYPKINQVKNNKSLKKEIWNLIDSVVVEDME